MVLDDPSTAILIAIVVRVLAVTVVLLGISLVTIVGVAQLRAVARQGVGRQIRRALPYFVFLGIVLGSMATLRSVGSELSWRIGFELSSVIYEIEGGTVVLAVQSVPLPRAPLLFPLVYVFGYVYLLSFPFLAYLLSTDLRPFRTLSLAYAFNYVVGVILYIAFVAYGPRNYYNLGAVEVLYNVWPESQLLTSMVNTNTNVFPSLHSSVSTTIAIMAVKTRDRYPLWTPIAVVLAALVCLSTMYLAIHWATDVVAGIVLAFLSVWFAERYYEQYVDFIERARDRTLEVAGRLRSRIADYRVE